MARAASRSHGPPRVRTHAGTAAGTQWLTGVHAVREALRARRRRLDRLALRGERIRPEQRELADLAAAAGLAVRRIEAVEFDRQLGEEVNPQGVALRVGPLPEIDLDDLLAAEASGPRRWLALDGVEDPQNVGAVARVADAAGVAGLILTERRAAPLSPAVSRASAGAIEWLPVARVPNLARALARARAAGAWVIAATAGSGRSLYHDVDDRLLAGDLVVVLGAEGRGIRPGVRAEADVSLEIPMRGRVASLNVATAGAVMLFEILRRTFPSGAGK